MALRSQLFRGDAKLEAAAESDPDHIVPGAKGNHVSKIQKALIQLDGAAIAQDGAYGPATAAAVLAYKQKRNIVNRGYQTKADNIVGKMTMAALDQEMQQKESQSPGPNTCQLLPPCACGVSNRAVVQLGFAITAAAAAPPTDAAIMQQAFQASRRSLRQAVASLNHLIQALMAQARGKGGLSAEDQRVFKAVTKWLNLRTRPDQIAAVAHIHSAVTLMNRNLTIKTSAGADPVMSRVSAAFFAETDLNQPNNGLRCGTSFFAFGGSHCRRDVVTHEFFHLFGIHHGGSALNGPTIRNTITTPAQSLDSADNLAQLVAEIVTRGGKTDACATAGE